MRGRIGFIGSGLPPVPWLPRDVLVGASRRVAD